MCLVPLCVCHRFGFTYAHRLVDDPRLDRSNITQRIANKEFDLIVYGSGTRHLLVIA